MNGKFLFSIFMVVILISAGCQEQPSAPMLTGSSDNAAKLNGGKNNGDGAVTVMTRNIYVGANVDAILGAAGDPEQLPQIVTEVFQDLLDTDFPARAKLLAAEIATANPHMIGLQEVSMVRTQIPGDFLTDNTPATDVLYDYLEILMAELSMLGLDYRVAGMVQNFDVELPMIGETSLDDVRLTDFDVVLVRNDVETFRTKAGNYDAMFEIEVPGFTSFQIKRGYVLADVRIDGKRYRFASTHLEDPSSNPLLEYVQLAQAQELVKMLDNQSNPVILVGDFNSKATDSELPGDMTYLYMLSENFTDVWSINSYSGDPLGFTYGHTELLDDPDDEFYERIDYVFLRNKVDPFNLEMAEAWVVGRDEGFDELWPSDHGGVVAHVNIPGWSKGMAGK
jgi:hypothetical protein